MGLLFLCFEKEPTKLGGDNFGFSKMLALLQIKDRGNIILANAGNFYIARGKDALLLNQILGLKLSYLEMQIFITYLLKHLRKYGNILNMKYFKSVR